MSRPRVAARSADAWAQAQQEERRSLRLFILTSLACSAVLAALTSGAAFLLTAQQSDADARASAETVATIVVADIARFNSGDATSWRVLESVMRTENVLHVVVWDALGEVVWSDVDAIVGKRFALSEGVLDKLGADASRPVPGVDTLEATSLPGVGDHDQEMFSRAALASGQPLVVASYITSQGLLPDESASLILLLPFAVVALLLLQGSNTVFAMARQRQSRKSRQERILATGEAMAALERQRRLVAHQLHDGLVQNLAGIRYAVSAVALAVPTGLPGQPEVTLERIGAILGDELVDLRTMLSQLIPPDVVPGTLAEALGVLVPGLLPDEITAVVVVDGVDATTDEILLVSRIVREAVRNAVRHAEATSLEVRVLVDHDTGDLRLTVDDDGRGLRPGTADDATSSHFGLWLIEEMLRDHGGSLNVADRRPHGVRLAATVPRLTSVAGRVQDPQPIG